MLIYNYRTCPSILHQCAVAILLKSCPSLIYQLPGEMDQLLLIGAPISVWFVLASLNVHLAHRLLQQRLADIDEAVQVLPSLVDTSTDDVSPLSSSSWMRR